jgi:hypothetical protein
LARSTPACPKVSLSPSATFGLASRLGDICIAAENRLPRLIGI